MIYDQFVKRKVVLIVIIKMKKLKYVIIFIINYYIACKYADTVFLYHNGLTFSSVLIYFL